MRIYNAQIYTMAETPFEGWIEFDEKILDMGRGKPTEIFPSDVNAMGGVIIPGFIDAHTHMGVIESGLGFEGDDCNEATDPFTPNLRAIDGINPMDKYWDLAREQGITTVAVSPGSANPVGGRIVAAKTTGGIYSENPLKTKRIDDMVLATVGIKFALGENPKAVYNERNIAPVTRMAVAGVIRDGLYKAKQYAEQHNRYKIDPENEEMPEYDAKCHALLPVLRREQKAHFHCHRSDDIFTALRISKEFNLDTVLVHATEGYMIADILSKEEIISGRISAIIGPLLCDCSKPELQNQDLKNASSLLKSGVKIAICTDHPETPIQFLSLTAAAAMKGGMVFDNAMRCVTVNAAEILGIEDRVGSLKIGMDADLQLYDGYELFSMFSKPSRVFINGVEIN
jgi:imidazolonepropionase-like amidohydrolase